MLYCVWSVGWDLTALFSTNTGHITPVKYNFTVCIHGKYGCKIIFSNPVNCSD